MATALTVDQLPDPDDRAAVFAFAMTFNGYKELGSLEAASAAARERRRSTLAEVRNELFFLARASRHREDDEYLDVYRELLPHFHGLLGAG